MLASYARLHFFHLSPIPAYVKVRGEMLGDVRPAFMLQIVTQLIKPEVLVEVEVIAASK